MSTRAPLPSRMAPSYDALVWSDRRNWHFFHASAIEFLDRVFANGQIVRPRDNHSVVAQCNEWIDATGSASGYVDADQSDDRGKHRRGGERRDIARRDVVQERSKQAADGDRD